VLLTDFELECMRVCTHCRKAKEMEEAKQPGHSLRYRKDTGEWVHDFVRGEMFQHVYCVATPLRKTHRG